MLGDTLIYKYIDEINKAIADIKISNHPKIIFEITLLKLIDSNNIRTDDINDTKISIDKEIEKLEQNDITVQPKQAKIIVEKKDETVAIPNMTTKEKKDDSIEKSKNDDKIVFLPNVSIPQHKKILINNTLAEANKKLLSEVNDKFNKLSTFLINKDFKQAAAIVMDGKIVGISNNNIIISYQYDAIVDKADTMIIEIEALLDKVAGQKFKVINITNNSWQDIRPFFVKTLKENGKIDILPEINEALPKVNIKHKKASKEIEEAINMFGEDLIEIK
jgi:DNA polymerase-3 subunit gamma/tau